MRRLSLLVLFLACTLNAHNGTSSIRWSPDGTMLLFFEGPPKGLASWLSLISLGSGRARPLLKDYSGTSLACEWTPDSKQLIAEAVVDTRVKLLRIDVGSAEVITLADISADILYDSCTTSPIFLSVLTHVPSRL
jgi:hypothetical protein